jgi:hypothetical protein
MMGELHRRSAEPKAESVEGEDCQPGTEGKVYQIRVKAHLDSHWSGWFEGMAVAHEQDGTTLLTGIVADQPALHGLLTKIRDLGVPLLSVEQVGKEQE